MAEEQVTHYRLTWDIDDNRGGVALRFANGQEGGVPADSAAELAGLAAILDKPPVTYDTDGRRLTTGWVEVGGA